MYMFASSSNYPGVLVRHRPSQCHVEHEVGQQYNHYNNHYYHHTTTVPNTGRVQLSLSEQQLGPTPAATTVGVPRHRTALVQCIHYGPGAYR